MNTSVVRHTVSSGDQLGLLAAAATGLGAFLGANNLSSEDLFDRVHLEPSALSSPTATIGLDKYCAVLESAARQSNDADLGLNYGQQFRPEMLGLIGYIALSSPNLVAASENLARYFCYHQQSTVTMFEYHAPFYHLTYHIDTPRITERYQDAIVTLGMFCNVFRHCAGQDWMPDEVRLQAAAIPNLAMVEKAFGAPVRLNCSTNALLFRPERVDRPMPNADLRLLDLLCANLVRLGMSTPALCLHQKLKMIIRERLANDLTIAQASEALSIPEWTLRRRLSEDNTSFKDLVEQVRREMASEYLMNRHFQIGEISTMLGYSEISAFTRAFQRWHDVSPSQYRKAAFRMT